MRPAHPRRTGIHGRLGFTLLEVMMALTIFGLVAVTVYGTFARTLRSKSLAEDHIELTQTGRSAVARMADEIASAYYPRLPLYSDAAYASIRPLVIFRSLQGGTEELPLDALMFTALSARPAGAAGRDSDQRIINYFFPTAPGRTLRRDAAAARPGSLGSGDRRLDEAEDFFAAFGPRPTPPPGTTPERLLRREAIMSSRDALDQAIPTSFVENVASLGFRFYNGTDWLDTWDSEDTVNYRPLPRAVEIDLGLYDLTGEIHHFTTAVDLALADTLPGPRASGGPSASSPSPRTAATPRAGT
jgi:prepilin-type N-terminal cleavage/methylation domain-containing protein